MAKSKIRAGDTVLHRPSGETWIVGAVEPYCDTRCLVPFKGIKEIAKIFDCELRKSCTDGEHVEMVLKCSKIRGEPPSYFDVRASWSKALLVKERESTDG